MYIYQQDGVVHYIINQFSELELVENYSDVTVKHEVGKSSIVYIILESIW